MLIFRMENLFNSVEWSELTTRQIREIENEAFEKAICLFENYKSRTINLKETCQPDADDIHATFAYNALFTNVRFYKHMFTMLNIDIALTILIGTVLMSAMGMLAVELSNSVSHIFTFKKNWFLCTRLSYRCKTIVVVIIAALFTLTSLSYLIWFSVEIH
jgi:hypothetical protein